MTVLKVLYICLFGIISTNEAYACVEATYSCGDNKKIVPVIAYSPFDFINDLEASFKFNPAKSCLILNKGAKSDSVIWYNDYPYQGNFKYSKIKLELSSLQDSILASVDSVFVFTPFPLPSNCFIPQNITSLGYIRNEVITIMDREKSYNLDSFFQENFGSLDNYIQLYIRETEDAFYSSRNGLMSPSDVASAKNTLNNSFTFGIISGKTPDTAAQSLVSDIEQILRLSDKQKRFLHHQVKEIEKRHPDILSSFLAGRSLNLFNNGDLHMVFSQEECQIINNIIKKDEVSMLKAYRMIQPTIPNVDANGQFCSDKDVLDSIISMCKD